MNPNLTKSVGSTWSNSAESLCALAAVAAALSLDEPASMLLSDETRAVNPIDVFCRRCCTIFSRPTNAPEQMKRMLDVSARNRPIDQELDHKS